MKDPLTHLPDQAGSSRTNVRRVQGLSGRLALDQLAIEEPLEIRLIHGPRDARLNQSISITMRTPGFDFDLAAGFLFTEGIVRARADIETVAYPRPDAAAFTAPNTVLIELKPEVLLDVQKLTRHFYTSSSCGVCGKSSIEALRSQSPYKILPSKARFSAERVHRLPGRLRASQDLFDSTGGMHASALVNSSGEIVLLREDVGRHNALDKVIGHAFLSGLLPLHDSLLLVSGRASFELIQKATMAGIGIFAAVGAPSSLAVELAHESGMTLLGFVRNDRFNIYANESRIQFAKED